MSQSQTVNRRIVLARRPRGAPTPEDFRLETGPVPEPGEGQVLTRTLHLSLDPYMREVMNAVPPVYASSVPVGGPMVGGTVGRVVASRNPAFAEGGLVLGNGGWQDYALSDGRDLTPLEETARPSQALGVLGMPAFTAHVGLLDIGRPAPGETVVVAAATGAVGGMVGQIARLKGARVVGIVGGEDKRRYLLDELGFDVGLDRNAPGFAEALAAACPDGIDVYFENVGGAVFDAVLPLLNIGARVPVCGVIAHYNDAGRPPRPDPLPDLLKAVLQKRILMQGIVILDHYGPRHDAFQREMGAWVEAGLVKAREHVVEGLENAPGGLIDLLEGRNFGKTVVRIADA